jgi:transketolase
MPSLKPFDKELLFGTARQVKAIVSVEDHSVNGGLGSIVAEALAENDCAVKFARLGVQDIFGESGSKKELFKKFGIDAEAIEKKILELVR